MHIDTLRDKCIQAIDRQLTALYDRVEVGNLDIAVVRAVLEQIAADIQAIEKAIGPFS